MHELAITQSILDIAQKVAQEHGATKVKTVHIKLGEYSGVVPQCVQDYFDVISQGTMPRGRCWTSSGFRWSSTVWTATRTVTLTAAMSAAPSAGPPT